MFLTISGILKLGRPAGSVRGELLNSARLPVKTTELGPTSGVKLLNSARSCARHIWITWPCGRTSWQASLSHIVALNSSGETSYEASPHASPDRAAAAAELHRHQNGPPCQKEFIVLGRAELSPNRTPHLVRTWKCCTRTCTVLRALGCSVVHVQRCRARDGMRGL